MQPSPAGEELEEIPIMDNGQLGLMLAAALCILQGMVFIEIRRLRRSADRK